MDDNDVMQFLKTMAENERQRFTTLSTQLVEIKALLEMLYLMEKNRLSKRTDASVLTRLSESLDPMVSEFRDRSVAELIDLKERVAEALRET
jgi:hypothetical protein